MSTAPRRRLVLVDGHANVFRAYHAIKEALINSRGETTHATLGFLNMLLRLRRVVDCTHIAMVFDAAAPSFRHLADPDYKATRRETPADLITQFGRIRQVLEVMRIPIIESPGFEADDSLATLAVQALAHDGDALVCSVDKDVLQVVRPGITIWREHLGKSEELDSAAVIAKLGVNPGQVADYLALVGDTADNLPGIPGIGPKTAAALLNEYGTVEALVAAAKDLPDKKKKMKENILEHGERCLRTLEMTRLRFDVPIEFSWDRFRWDFKPSEELRQLLLELEFGRMISELGLQPPAAPAPAPAPAPAVRKAPNGDTQTSLFDEPDKEDGSPAAAPPTLADDTRYSAVTTMRDLDSAAAAIRAAGVCAVDTETTGLDPFVDQLVGISLSWAPDQGIYIPLAHKEKSPQLAIEDVRRVLDQLFADPAIKFFAHHWKFDYKILLRAGFTPPKLADDTMISAWLLTPDRGQGVTYGLKGLARDRLGVVMSQITELIGTGDAETNMALVPVESAGRYAAQDADMTHALHRSFAPRVQEANLANILHEIELPLTPVLARMELEGVRIDPAYFTELARDIERDLALVRESVYEAAGREFNINSPKQVGEILFEELKLPTSKKVKTGYSTDVTVLEDLKKIHPLPARLLEFRHLDKLRSTYVEALPRAIHPLTSRVHTSYGQTDAATGRLSSNDPNLQNIPVRSSDGMRVRRGFTPRQPGWSFVAADYSQIELRILAHMSGDAALTEAFKSGSDVHALTASKVLGIPLAELTPAQRNQAKAINFGIIYGMSAFRLARDMELDRATAEKFIADYFAVYSGVKNFIENTKSEARETGFVRTLCGRRRPILEINSRNYSARGQAERIAVNTPIQGTSADMIKLAMVRIDHRITREKLAARMILQVHDELIIDSPDAEVETVMSLVCEEMTAALPLGDVPIKVDVNSGPNWAEV